MKSHPDTKLTERQEADTAAAVERRAYEEPKLTVEPLHKAILASTGTGGDLLGGTNASITPGVT